MNVYWDNYDPKCKENGHWFSLCLSFWRAVRWRGLICALYAAIRAPKSLWRSQSFLSTGFIAVVTLTSRWTGIRVNSRKIVPVRHTDAPLHADVSGLVCSTSLTHWLLMKMDDMGAPSKVETKHSDCPPVAGCRTGQESLPLDRQHIYYSPNVFFRQLLLCCDVCPGVFNNCQTEWEEMQLPWLTSETSMQLGQQGMGR